MPRVFGHIENVPVGARFNNRSELATAGVHKPTQAGISGSQAEGADSVVLSGGYEDDLDLGDRVVYTGHGGQDPQTREQIKDQELALGNLALKRNVSSGLPVRFVRGPRASLYSPDSGYRYDGLYRVADAWHEIGNSGYLMWRFRLEALEAFSPQERSTDQEQVPPPRVPQTVQRIVRDTALSRHIKELHDFTCQVCGERLGLPTNPYAEAAHIRPLGEPHNGPDVRENILCLCPNHHVLFDLGAFTIDDDLTLISLPGALRTISQHKIGLDYVRYHRTRYGSV